MKMKFRILLILLLSDSFNSFARLSGHEHPDTSSDWKIWIGIVIIACVVYLSLYSEIIRWIFIFQIKIQ